MPKKIMILGASRYYIRSILAAKTLGYKVIVTDRNPAAEGFQQADHSQAVDITDIEGSLAVAKKYRIDGIIPVNDFGVRTAAAIAETLGLPGISSLVAEYATNKALMRAQWAKTNVPSAAFRVVKTLDEATTAVEALDSWPLVLKPADSRGGASRGVSIINDKTELPAALEFAQSFYKDKSVVIEEFLDGVEHSLETITYEGETYILAVSDKVKTPLPYRVDKSVIYPTIFKGVQLQQICEVARSAIQALGIEVGAVHVEMCSTEDGPRLFEVGARCGGGGTPDPIVPFVTGVEMFKEAARIAVGEKPHRLQPYYTRGCVYRFITPQPGRVKKTRNLEAVKGWKNILDCEVLVGEGDQVRSVQAGGDRAGFVIAGGETRAEAIALADKAENHIHFEYINGNIVNEQPTRNYP